MYILGVETSCDETAVALLDLKEGGAAEVLNEKIASQTKLHAEYGGVVPELASREHLYNLPLIFDSVLKDSGVELDQIDCLAVTRGPGLLGCLLMGLNFARGLAMAKSINLVGVNHIEGHIWANFLKNNPSSAIAK